MFVSVQLACFLPGNLHPPGCLEHSEGWPLLSFLPLAPSHPLRAVNMGLHGPVPAESPVTVAHSRGSSPPEAAEVSKGQARWEGILQRAAAPQHHSSHGGVCPQREEALQATEGTAQCQGMCCSPAYSSHNFNCPTKTVYLLFIFFPDLSDHQNSQKTRLLLALYAGNVSLPFCLVLSLWYQ